MVSTDPHADGGQPLPDPVGRSRRALETLAFRALGLPLTLLTAIMTSRLLLPEGRGAYVLGVLSATVAATLFGIGTAITHHVGRRTDRVQAIVVRGLLMSCLLGIGAALIVFPANRALSSGSSHVIQFCALGIPAMLIVESIGGALLALGRLRVWNILQLLGPALIFTGTALLVAALDYGVGGAVVAWLVAQWVVAILALVWTRYLWLSLERRHFSLVVVGSMLVLGLSSGAARIVALINYRIEFFVLEAYEGLKAVGIYSVAIALAELLWILSRTLTTVSLAPVVQLESERAVSAVAQATRHTLLLTSVFGILLGASGTLLVPVVFGNEFASSVTPLLLLIPGVAAFAPAAILSAYFGDRMGQMRRPLAVAGISATMTGALCLVLIPPLGVNGAALASTVSYTLGAAIMVVIFLSASGIQATELVPKVADLLAYRDLVRGLVRRAG